MPAIELDITLTRPAAYAGQEPNAVQALLRVRKSPEAAVRPLLDLCFVLDSSASMHQFVLTPEQRAHYRSLADARGEVSRQSADGQMGMVWTGQTLRDMQKHVSTPMLSCLRGVWRTLEALGGSDRIAVLAFADQAGVIYEDSGAAAQAPRLDAAKNALARLGSGVDASGLGRGTRLQAALQQALDRMAAQSGVPALRRVLLVSDGVVEDAEACRALLDRAISLGIVISVIGVGDEFDEEFLMTIADFTRGNYYYAATAAEVEQAVYRELGLITSVVGRQAVLRVVPQSGAIISDVYPVLPAMSEFQTMWVEQGAWRFCLGDLSTAEETQYLIELAPASLPEGQARLATVRVEGSAPLTDEPILAEAPVHLLYTSDQRLLQARDDEVLDLVGRLEVYLEERRAAKAIAMGDTDGATKHLKAATRMLRKMGADDLAEDMDAAADDMASGTRNLSRTKKVKSGTRSLGQSTRRTAPPPPAEGSTRNIR